MKEINDTEYLKLIISIINSFVLSKNNFIIKLANSSDIKLILNNYSQLTSRTIKIILNFSEKECVEKTFFENCFRLLKFVTVIF